MGNPGSVLPAVAHFRWIRWIRWIRRRIPGGSKSEYSTTILALFAGKWGPILRPTLKKPKENQGFWLQPLKNLRKIKVFGPWGPRAQGPRVCQPGPELKGPKRTPFLSPIGSPSDHSGLPGGHMRRISARISPDRSHPLNLNFFWTKIY